MTNIPPPPPPSSEAKRYEGLGGWLILVAIGLIITPLRLGVDGVRIFLPLFAPEKWHLINTPGSELYHPYLGPLLIYEVAGNTTTALFALVMLGLFFSRKRFFLKLMILYLAVNALFVFGDHVLVRQVFPGMATSPQGIRELARVTAGCLIWIPYLLVSKRVKATFTT